MLCSSLSFLFVVCDPDVCIVSVFHVAYFVGLGSPRSRLLVLAAFPHCVFSCLFSRCELYTLSMHSRDVVYLSSCLLPLRSITVILCHAFLCLSVWSVVIARLFSVGFLLLLFVSRAFAPRLVLLVSICFFHTCCERVSCLRFGDVSRVVCNSLLKFAPY